MKNFRKQNGITLITLMITIIVLTILVLVATSQIKNDEPYGHANNLKGDFNELQSGYNQIIDGLENEVLNDFRHD